MTIKKINILFNIEIKKKLDYKTYVGTTTIKNQIKVCELRLKSVKLKKWTKKKKSCKYQFHFYNEYIKDSSWDVDLISSGFDAVNFSY